MIKCVIIDDEQDAINVLKRFIEKLPNLKLVGESTNPITGLEIIKREEPDLVFLDIQMDQMSGIELAKAVQQDTKIVFCTAYTEFAVESYDLNAIDYLMKPVMFPRFTRSVQRVMDALASRPSVTEEAIPNDYIFVKAGQKEKMIRIDFDDIDFVESQDHYIAFYSGDKKTMAYLSLKKIEERLPSSQFMRVHRSYIVALKQIVSLTNGELVLKRSSMRIPLGAFYKEAFMNRMKDKLMS